MHSIGTVIYTFRTIPFHRQFMNNHLLLEDASDQQPLGTAGAILSTTAVCEADQVAAAAVRSALVCIFQTELEHNPPSTGNRAERSLRGCHSGRKQAKHSYIFIHTKSATRMQTFRPQTIDYGSLSLEPTDDEKKTAHHLGASFGVLSTGFRYSWSAWRFFHR